MISFRRAAAVEALRVHRQQVSAFMLKHGRVFPRKKGWTMRECPTSALWLALSRRPLHRALAGPAARGP